MIYNVGFNRASATSAVEKNGADMVALGQAFIANPDLVERYRNGWTVNRPRVATYYSQGPDGYIDYPVHADRYAEQQQSADEALVPIMPQCRYGAGAASQPHTAHREYAAHPSPPCNLTHHQQ